MFLRERGRERKCLTEGVRDLLLILLTLGQKNNILYTVSGKLLTCLCDWRELMTALWKLSKYFCPVCPVVHRDRSGDSSVLSPFFNVDALSDHPSLLSAPQKSYPFNPSMLQHDHPSIFSMLPPSISIKPQCILVWF